MALPGRALWLRVAAIGSWLLLAVGCAGLVVLTRLPLRLYQVLVAWQQALTGFHFPQVLPNVLADTYHTALAPLEAVVADSAWLWPLLAALGLLLAMRNALPQPSQMPRWRSVLFGLVLLVALGLGIQQRLGPLANHESALTWTMDYDEGVYVSFAREWAHGSLLYRDMWASHPPTGIALLVPVVAASPTGEAALINARRLTAVFDLLAGLLLVWVGAQLASPAGGLLAACVYLLDRLAGGNSSHVWLETSVNLWSILALGCLLHGIRRERLAWLAAAGGLALLAATTKYTGVALGIAALITLLLAGRWRWAGAFAFGGALATLLYALLILPLGWRELVQQTLVAQLLRPVDEITPFIRLDAALHTSASLLTTVGAALGACVIAIRRPKMQLGWALVFTWLALVLALLIRSPTFYDHYTTQLVAPLALLAGGIMSRTNNQQLRTVASVPTFRPGDQRGFQFAVRGWWFFLLALLLPLFLAQQFAQPKINRSDDVVANARALAERVPSGQPIITFEPLFNLLADRPFGRAPDQRLLIDSYMHLRNIQIDWAGLSWAQTLAQLWSHGALPQQPWPNASAIMLERGQWAMFDGVRKPRTKAEYVALAGNYRAIALPSATLYQHTPITRRFVAGTVQMRGLLVPTVVQAGQQLPIAMFWQKPAPEPRSPIVSLQLVSSNGQKIGQYDKPVGPAEAGLQAWPVGLNTYQDDLTIPVAANAPAGEYALLMVVYDPATGQRWPLTNEQGQLIGESLIVDTVTVTSAGLR